MDKIDVSINQALPLIAEMIKFSYLTKVAGYTTSWIYNKWNHERTSSTSKGFDSKDICVLNRAIREISGELSGIVITASKEGSEEYDKEWIVEQLKRLSRIVPMPYIYGKKMGKPRQWYSHRIHEKNKPNAYRFTKEEITLFNLYIKEIANYLSSINLTE